ncbi:MAG: DUF2207 domain-containing protein [Micrococcales bacterium]|nr:DUF2207 domain-containing protein [Micrococcales bacterium]MCL2667472.1 DUF2207 domain-containing protein [Micrococcales bacterium]
MWRVFGFALAGAVVLGWAAPAQAVWAPEPPAAQAVDIQATLSQEGVLTVEQTFTFDTGAPATLSQQVPRHTDRDGRRYSYDLDKVSATVDGKAATVSQSQSGQATTLSVDAKGATTVVVTYEVTGTTTSAPDHKIDFTWPVLDGLDIDVTSITGTVEVPPGGITYDCRAGAPGALGSCGTFAGGTHDSRPLTFTHKGLVAGQTIQAGVLFSDKAMLVVTEQASDIRTFADSFTLGAVELGVMAGVLLVGGVLLFLWWRRVRTGGYQGVPVHVASLTCDDGVTSLKVEATGQPGMIGTLVDLQVDPADILATILDLAQRGHLRITELETTTYEAPDWTFTRLECDDELVEYESLLLDALTTSEVKVSELSTSVGESIAAVQAAVYDEVLAAGWFSRLPSQRPKAVTWAWGGIAAAVVVAGVLAAVTTFGLAGLALIAVSVVALAVAAQTLVVTPTGAAVYAGLADLSRELHTCEMNVEPGREYEELSRILPYAVVLGGWDRWLEAVVAADDDPDPDSTDLNWYHAPADWHMRHLPDSLDSFITVVTGRLFART